MATVNKSDKTYDVIVGNIARMFRERERKAQSWGVDERTFASMVFAHVVSDELLVKLNSVPDVERFIRKENQFYVRFTYEDGRTTSPFPFTLEKPSFMFLNMQSYSSSTTIPRNEETKQIYDIYDGRSQQMAAVATAHEEFKETFRAMWNQVSSVNALIKIWPAAWELLNDDIRERLKRKTGGRSSGSSVNEEEIRKLNAAFLAAKVSQ